MDLGSIVRSENKGTDKLSSTATMQLIRAFVFANAKSRFSQDVAYYGYSLESPKVILLSTHKLYFHGEFKKITLQHNNSLIQIFPSESNYIVNLFGSLYTCMFLISPIH